MLAEGRGASRSDTEAVKDAMLGILFRGLTASPARGASLFDAVAGEARRPHWYVEGEIPDTIDGRFALLATIVALVMVRLDQLGDAGSALSVALTERFVEVMEAEHRELGLGDPGLGKTVRKLVGSVARRTELWRTAIDGSRAWRTCAMESLPLIEGNDAAVRHVCSGLESLWSKLEQAELAALAHGRIE